MVPITELWLPILLSAVAVFVLSSIIHMALRYHAADFKAVPNEDGVMDALHKFSLQPGDYCLPKPANMAQLKDPAFIDKCKKGPNVIMTVLPSGQPNMGPQLGQWFLFGALVSLVAAYIAGRALSAGAESGEVVRFAGTTAFLCYSMAYIPASIWYRKSWATTFRNMLDGLVYGLATGGVFAWLWPQ